MIKEPSHIHPVMILDKSLNYVEENGLLSHDPFDALSSPLIYGMTRLSPLLQRIMIQLNRRSPVNVRDLVGIRKRIHPMSLSHLASAYVLLHKRWPDRGYEAKIRACLEKLDGLKAEGAYCSWGLNFPYVTRFVTSGSRTPNIFTTVNVANAYLDAYELLGDSAYLTVARSSAAFAVEQLGFVAEGGSGWFRYYPSQQVPVYNVNAMMAAFLSRLSRVDGDTRYDELSRKAIRFIHINQNQDGSWYYARDGAGEWIDGFHTGYILESLAIYDQCHPGEQAAPALAAGREFYLCNLFTAAGTPKYYSGKLYPIDGQNCAQAVQTLARLAKTDPACRTMAGKALRMTVRQLFIDRGQAGYFMTSRNRLVANPLYSLRWTHAPMISAMAHFVTEGLE